MYNKRIIIISLIVLLVLSITTLFVYKNSIFTAEGWIAVEKKEVIDGECFIFVLNDYDKKEQHITRLECDSKQFEEIIVDSQILYHISYKYSKYTPTKGNLIFIISDDPFYTGKT